MSNTIVHGDVNRLYPLLTREIYDRELEDQPIYDAVTSVCNALNMPPPKDSDIVSESLEAIEGELLRLDESCVRDSSTRCSCWVRLANGVTCPLSDRHAPA